MVEAFETALNRLIQSFLNIEELLVCSSMKMMVLLIQFLGSGESMETNTEE